MRTKTELNTSAHAVELLSRLEAKHDGLVKAQPAKMKVPLWAWLSLMG